jgi:hypothetical protein
MRRQNYNFAHPAETIVDPPRGDLFQFRRGAHWLDSVKPDLRTLWQHRPISKIADQVQGDVRLHLVQPGGQPFIYDIRWYEGAFLSVNAGSKAAVSY